MARSALVVAAGAPGAVDAAVEALRDGGIVGVPTETVYGLAVLPQPKALAALIAAKGRPADKGIVLLIDSLDQVAGLVEVPAAARRLADAFWPGALTLVLPLLPGVVVPDVVTGGRATLGLRLPDHVVPRALARRLGPLAVSSANRTGEPESVTAAELVAAIGEGLALVLDDGPARGRVPSSVVAVDRDGSWRVLREGALSQVILRRGRA